MSDVAEFLRARYTYDRAALLDVDRALGEDRRHILSVARRVADIDAKWAIVARCEKAANLVSTARNRNYPRVHDAAVTLQWLMQEYAWHPDFRAEWKVDPSSPDLRVLS